MNQEFFIKNREKLITKMEDHSILVLFAGEAPIKSADELYRFTPNKNFYYLTGINREKIILMIVKRGDKVDQSLFVEKPDPVLEKWVGKKLDAQEARTASGIHDVCFLDEFKSRLARILSGGDMDALYLDLEARDWEGSLSREQRFAGEMVQRYPYLRMKNIYPSITRLRMIKSEEEVELIRQAIALTDKGLRSMMENACPGMKEYQLEAYFDFTLKTEGVKETAFNTIAASGANGTVLHYDKNDSEMGEKDLILFDLGAKYQEYNADISRTFPVSGKFTERQKEIYNIVLKAQAETIAAVRPGAPFKILNEITKQALARECKAIGLIKEDWELSKYYYHGVSHYLGLDTHDVGVYDIDLEPGMVLTMEPGLYIEEEGIGIRIEDDILVTENGCENLSAQIIKTVEEIEAFMKKQEDE